MDENFDEIALSHTVKEIEANLCFAIFGKNSKIQNGRHFWGGENFLKIAKRTFFRYPGERIFQRNRSISQKFENWKIVAIFGEGKIFENCHEYNAQIPCGSKTSHG